MTLWEEQRAMSSLCDCQINKVTMNFMRAGMSTLQSAWLWQEVSAGCCSLIKLRCLHLHLHDSWLFTLKTAGFQPTVFAGIECRSLATTTFRLRCIQEHYMAPRGTRWDRWCHESGVRYCHLYIFLHNLSCAIILSGFGWLHSRSL